MNCKQHNDKVGTQDELLAYYNLGNWEKIIEEDFISFTFIVLQCTSLIKERLLFLSFLGGALRNIKLQ